MAAIVGSAAGGASNTNGAWTTSVQPTSADDVTMTAASGNMNIPSGATLSCRSIDFTGYTNTFTFSATTSTLQVGDASGGACKFSSTMTLTLTAIGLISFVSTTASTTYSLTSAGRVLPSITVNTGSTTTIQFADAVTATGATLTLTSGKWDWNSQSVTAGSWTSNNSTTRSQTCGTASVALTGGGTVWNLTTTTGMTLGAASCTITMSGAAATFVPGNSQAYGTLVFTGSGAAVLSNASQSLATYVNITRTGTAAKTDSFTVQAATTISSAFTTNGNSATNRVLVQSNTVGTSRTITAATVTVSNADFQDITGAGAGSWNLSAITGNSGDCGGNSGITFTASVQQTATGTASFTWSTHGWTTRVPLPQDDVVINNAFIAGRTITADMPRLGRSIDFTGCTGSPILSLTIGSGASIFGSLTLVSGMTTNTANEFTFAGRSSFSITSAGVTFAQGCIISAPSGTYTFADAMTSSRNSFTAVRILIGTLVDNAVSVTLTAASSQFSMTGGTLTKTGAWSIAATAAASFWGVIGGAVTDSGTITLSATSTNTRTFAGGGKTYGTLTYTVAGSTGGLTITGANTFTAINFSDASNARTLTLPASTTTTVTTFTVNGTAGLLMSVVSSAGGTAATLALANPSTMNYLSVQDITATPSNAVYVLDGTNVSGNTGIVFEPNTAQHPSLRLTLIPAIAARGGGNAATQRASSW